MIKNRLFSVLALTGLLASTLTLGPNRSYAADELAHFSRNGQDSERTRSLITGTRMAAWPSRASPSPEEIAQEQSDTDGKTYTVQYFERAVFEKHPENAGSLRCAAKPLLGVLRLCYNETATAVTLPVRRPALTNPRTRSQKTGKTIGGAFRTYWEQNGGPGTAGLSDQRRISGEVSDSRRQDVHSAVLPACSVRAPPRERRQTG